MFCVLDRGILLIESVLSFTSLLGVSYYGTLFGLFVVLRFILLVCHRSRTLVWAFCREPAPITPTAAVDNDSFERLKAELASSIAHQHAELTAEFDKLRVACQRATTEQQQRTDAAIEELHSEIREQERLREERDVMEAETIQEMEKNAARRREALDQIRTVTSGECLLGEANQTAHLPVPRLTGCACVEWRTKLEGQLAGEASGAPPIRSGGDNAQTRQPLEQRRAQVSNGYPKTPSNNPNTFDEANAFRCLVAPPSLSAIRRSRTRGTRSSECWRTLSAVSASSTKPRSRSTVELSPSWARNVSSTHPLTKARRSRRPSRSRIRLWTVRVCDARSRPLVCDARGHSEATRLR